jgi:hypothetical protein
MRHKLFITAAAMKNRKSCAIAQIRQGTLQQSKSQMNNVKPKTGEAPDLLVCQAKRQHVNGKERCKQIVWNAEHHLGQDGDTRIAFELEQGLKKRVALYHQHYFFSEALGFSSIHFIPETGSLLRGNAVRSLVFPMRKLTQKVALLNQTAHFLRAALYRSTSDEAFTGYVRKL